MKPDRHPITPAIRVLREQKVAFEPHLYDYVEKGGTRTSSQELGVDEHAVVKTLIFENDRGEPLIVLMHGDCQVSTKELARKLGVKTISPCAPEIANRHSGYQVGGTSPFGTRKAMPVYVEKTILDLPRIYLNGGAKGFLVSLDPRELVRVLSPTAVEVAIRKIDLS